MKSNVTYAKPPVYLCALFFLTIILSNQLNAQRQNLLIDAGFEGSSPWTGWRYGTQFCCNYSVTQSSTVARAGTSSVKYDLRSSDPLVSGSVRAEIEPTGAGSNTAQESERWYGLSYYLSNYGSDNGAESILQWHDTDGSCPPLSLQVQGGRLRVQQCINGTNTPNDLGPVVSNQWFDIVMHVKWTTGNTGILEVWKDGVQIVNKRNIRTNSNGGSYIKVGINKWSWGPGGGSSSQTQRIFYIDEFRMGNENATYNDVAPSATTTPGNQAPVANAGADISLTLPTVIATLNGSATDADGSIASYSWSRVSGPTTFSLLNPLSAVTSLLGLIQGTYVFRLTVTDNNGATDTDDITVTVNPLIPVNQLPTANAGNDITLTLPANSTTLSGSATDPDGTIAGYTWTRVSGPTAFTLANPNSASTALSGLVQGTYVFRLTARDDDGGTDTDDVTVVVNAAANQLPTANAGNDITLTLPANSTTLSGSATDPDGTIAGYTWTRVSGPTAFTLANPNSASTALSGLVQGTYVFRVTARDDDGGTDTDDVTVVVNAAANQSPTANAGNNVTITLPNNSTNLSGSGSDPDGTIASYTWSRISGPTAYTFSDASAAATAVSGLVQGTYVFRLTVRDDDNATGTDDITVTVNAATLPPNQLPTANAGADISLTLPANSTTLNGASSVDPDGSIISYAWTRISGPTTFTLGTANAVSSTLTALVQGVYVFRLTVSDNRGGTDTDDITVTVNAAAPVNQAPNANAGNNISITLPANSTTLSGSATDADGTIASYAWTRISGPTTYTIANPAAGATALTGLVQGVYVFRLTVTDDDGATDIDDVTVTVNAAPPPPNQAPVANAGADIVITLPTNTTVLNGNASSDPDGTIATYSWARVSGPASYAFGNRNTSATIVNILVQGTYVFRLTVTDDDGVTDTDDVTVTVNAAPPPPANQLPVANAGADIIITLPNNVAVLNGAASTDADGTITTYAWTKISGPTSYAFGNANTSATIVNILTQGTYVFRLTVTDNRGGTDTDDITVTVNAATTPPPTNQSPVANPGTDIILYLPENSVTLSGTRSTDPDGLISTYQWTQLNGPSQLTIANRNASSVQLTDLMLGEYQFELTVTDNRGASSKASVKVFVRNKNGEGLYCILYPNPAANNLNLQYIGNNTGKVRINIYDGNQRYLLGQTVTKSQVTLNETFNIARLRSGTYFVEVILSGNKKIVRKFVKL